MVLLSKQAGNMPIYSTYNATHGGFRDLQESRMGLNLVCTPPAVLAFQRKNAFFAQASSKETYLEVMISQGNIHGLISQLMLPKEYRERVVALSIAPAVFQPEGLWKTAFHYYSSKDPIPHLQKVVGIISSHPKNVTVLTPQQGDGIGHSFSSKMYETHISRHIEAYLRGNYD